jgi:ubiquinone/menaquinone biosynthesis C-methylase UbiE/uncharacterized protein YbaR (Trm112 family)
VLPELLPSLACPTCRAGGLTLRDERVHTGPSGPVITSGSLLCGSCGLATALTDGIWDAMGARGTPRTLAQLTNVVPLTARVYEDLWRVRSLTLLSGRQFPIAEELAELDDWVGPQPGDVAVDVGTSEGLYARHLARRGALVLAVDHALAFLRRARLRAEREGLRIAPIRAMAQALPVRDGVCAAAVIGGSLNEIGDLAGCAAEMARVLQPGGRLFAMSLVRATSRPGRVVQALVRPSGIVFPTVDDTRRLWTDAGLQVVETRKDRVVLRTFATRPTT